MRYAGRLLALACSTIFSLFFLMQVAALIYWYIRRVHSPCPERYFPISLPDLIRTVVLGLLCLLSVFSYRRLARSRS